MSSITQYKEALKREKKVIADLKKQILLQQYIIDEQKHHISVLKARIDLKKKKWYQFWK